MDYIFLLLIFGGAGIGAFMFSKKANNSGPADAQKVIEKVDKAKTGQDLTIYQDIKDDMIIVSKYEYRAVLEIEPINLGTYSAQEQISIKERFRSAMFGIRYRFSFYLPSLRNNPQRTVNHIRKCADKYAEEELSNLSAYGKELADWVDWQANFRTPLEPGYFMVINYDVTGSPKTIADETLYQQAIRELDIRANGLMSALGRAELSTRRLKTTELHQLMYFCFNRELTEAVNFKDAEKKGIFGLYTTEKQAAMSSEAG